MLILSGDLDTKYELDMTKNKGAIDVFTLIAIVMHQSIPSLTIPPPGRPPGFAHSSCPWCRVFAPLSCPGICPGGGEGGLKSKFDNFEKSAIFALSLSSNSFHMFIYARSEHVT